MSKSINNYRGRHIGYKQKRAVKDSRERTGISPVTMMFINFFSKARVFQKARNDLRAKLNVKGKKALTGAKRQKVLDAFFAVEY